MNYQSLVDFQYWTFIAQICNLFLQIYLFKRFLFKPIQKIIAKRQEEVNQIYTEADKKLTSAEEMKKEYEQSLGTAREEAEAITARAVSSARVQSEAMLQQAQQEAAAMRQKATREIELERRKAMNEVKGDVSRLSVQIASKIARKEIREKEHAELIDSFIEELGDAG